MPSIIYIAVSGSIGGKMLAGHYGQLQGESPAPLVDLIFHFGDQWMVPKSVADLGNQALFKHPSF